MKIHMFVGCLSMQERRRLANQVKCSEGYLNQIARGHYFPSDEFIKKVYNSRVNRALIPSKMRITASDVEQHVTEARMRRTKSD